jgi:hypothetical protein
MPVREAHGAENHIMAKIDLAYDHPAYRVRVPMNKTHAAGSGVVTRFAAFTTMRAKSITIMPVTASTSADTTIVRAIDGTTTTALATITMGSAATSGVNTELSTAATHGTWGTSGFITITKGTDATAVYEYCTGNSRSFPAQASTTKDG